MALLQTSGYITQQMEADIVIDVNKFLGAFYESEFTRIRSYKHLGLQIDRERFNGVLNKPWSHLWSDQYCHMQSDGLCSLLTTSGGFFGRILMQNSYFDPYGMF